MSKKHMSGSKEIRLTGISGSPGICIGKAYLVDREGVDVIEKYLIPQGKLTKEVNRFKSAVKKAKDELAEIIEDVPEEIQQQIHVLEAHKALFKDKMIYHKTIDTIKKEQINAEWALKKVVSDVKEMFNEISDPYLKGRVVDITHVSGHIMRNLVGTNDINIADIDKRVILVAQDLSPAEASQIQLERIKGFITDRGGKASHTGIIARTIEIPSVLGLGNASTIIKNDDIIIVDGTAGLVIVHPRDETIIHYEDRNRRYEEFRAEITRESHRPAETKDGLNIKVMGNIELPEEIVSVINYGGDGIGLFRTEFLYLSRNSYPAEDELVDQFMDVVEIMSPNPVTIRTLDINGDKAVMYDNSPAEENPAMGLRAIRFCLKRPDVFMTQLRAILRVAAMGNVRIMFPMISSIDEVLDAKRLLNEAAESLDKEGINFNSDIDIGIMIEVPSAVVLANELAEMVDFFSIGTNDLVQYSLAIDRVNTQVAYMFQSLHPAVIRMVQNVINVGRDNNIKVAMCGEMAGDPTSIPILLGMGMDELSMNPQSMPAVKTVIRTLNSNESKMFLKDILKLNTSAEIIRMVQDTYGDTLSEAVYAE